MGYESSIRVTIKEDKREGIDIDKIKEKIDSIGMAKSYCVIGEQNGDRVLVFDARNVRWDEMMYRDVDAINDEIIYVLLSKPENISCLRIGDKSDDIEERGNYIDCDVLLQRKIVNESDGFKPELGDNQYMYKLEHDVSGTITREFVVTAESKKEADKIVASAIKGKTYMYPDNGVGLNGFIDKIDNLVESGATKNIAVYDFSRVENLSRNDIKLYNSDGKLLASEIDNQIVLDDVFSIAWDSIDG